MGMFTESEATRWLWGLETGAKRSWEKEGVRECKVTWLADETDLELGVWDQLFGDCPLGSWLPDMGTKWCGPRPNGLWGFALLFNLHFRKLVLISICDYKMNCDTGRSLSRSHVAFCFPWPPCVMLRPSSLTTDWTSSRSLGLGVAFFCACPLQLVDTAISVWFTDWYHS